MNWRLPFFSYVQSESQWQVSYGFRLVELLVKAVLFLSGEAVIPELTFRALPEPKRSVGSSNLTKLGLRCAVAEE